MHVYTQTPGCCEETAGNEDSIEEVDGVKLSHDGRMRFRVSSVFADMGYPYCIAGWREENLANCALIKHWRFYLIFDDCLQDTIIIFIIYE